MNITVAAVAMNSVPYKKEENLKSAARLVREAAKQGAKLIALPELFNTGYDVADKDNELSEPVPGGETVQWMEALSAELGVWLAGAIIERSDVPGILYDTCVLTGPEGWIGKYRKVCLWAAERLRFRSGSEYPVFHLGFANVGMQICYEIGFPEGARVLALNGADLIIYSAAFSRSRSYAWELGSRSRALENGLFVVASNRNGEEGAANCFAGKSRIVGPKGEVLAEAEAEEAVIWAKIDMAEVKKQRSVIPYLRDYPRRLFAEKIVGAD